MAREDGKTQILDRKFVSAAVLIGSAYALIVVAIGFFAGKEAAGVAGVALTAIATAVFKQFENLRFRQLREAEGKEIAVESPLVLLTLVSSISGAQGLVGVVLLMAPFAFFSVDAFMQYAMLSPMAVATTAFVALSSASAMVFLGSTYYSVRALRVVRYSTVIFANLIVAVFQLALPLALLYYALPEPMRLQAWVLLLGAAPWLIYMLMSLWGARLAKPRQVLPSVGPVAPPVLQLAPLEPESAHAQQAA